MSDFRGDLRLHMFGLGANETISCYRHAPGWDKIEVACPPQGP